MSARISLSFGIENKLDVKSILGLSSSIPKDELHVQRGTKYAEKLDGVSSKVSVALVAKADRRFDGDDYIIGYIANAKVVFNDAQARPLIINHDMIKRAVEFVENDFYLAYEIEVVSPPTDVFEFCRNRGALHPLATPCSLYGSRFSLEED